MSSYKELEIYQLAFDLAVRVHFASLKLPKYEIYEQGSQVRRSSKTIKDTIAEGYGRRKYKAEWIKFLTYAQSSCDECLSQIETIIVTHPEVTDFKELLDEYTVLGKKINNFIKYVETSWKT